MAFSELLRSMQAQKDAADAAMRAQTEAALWAKANGLWPASNPSSSPIANEARQGLLIEGTARRIDAA